MDVSSRRDNGYDSDHDVLICSTRENKIMQQDHVNEHLGNTHYQGNSRSQPPTGLENLNSAVAPGSLSSASNTQAGGRTALTDPDWVIVDENLDKDQQPNSPSTTRTSSANMFPPNYPTYDERGYCIEKIVGHGSFGVVAQVRHCDRPHTLYARKQLSTRDIDETTFEEEVDIIRRARHRHVIQILDYHRDNTWFYIVMTPLADMDLEAYLRIVVDHRPGDASAWKVYAQRRRQLFQWMYCLLVTIRDIHGRNIRHRDIKPQNILVKGDWIFLTDFGTSFTSDGLTRNTLTHTKASLRYEPPEAFVPSDAASDDGKQRQRTGREGDIISLGGVFFDMAEAASKFLVNEFPSCTGPYTPQIFNSVFLARVQKVEEHPTLMRRLPEDYRFGNSRFGTDLLKFIVSKMLHKDPQNRLDAAFATEELRGLMNTAEVPLQDCCKFK